MTENNLRRFYQLLQHFNIKQAYSVNLEQLETILSTSRRNTTIILKNLHQLSWIQWQPSKGRGRSSQLTLCVSWYDVLFQVIHYELNLDRFTLITKLINTYDATVIEALTEAKQQAQSQVCSNQLLIAQYPYLQTLDPVKTIRAAELQVIKSIYDTLLTQDKTGQLQPGIAHTWESKENVLTLWLRKNIVTHHGRILTMDDVIWSLNRLRHEDGPIRHLCESIVDIKADGPYCLTITLKSANVFFPYVLASTNTSIMCQSKELQKIGTGPFKIKKWDKEQLILEQHREYFGVNALIEKITLLHSEQEVYQSLSFNQTSAQSETTEINSFSYLTFNARKDRRLSPQTLSQLYRYLAVKKYQFDTERAVDSLTLQSSTPAPHHVPCPQLIGEIVLAEPHWTIPHLQTMSDWLHHTIRETGLTLKVIELVDISHPESMHDKADLMLIEEIIEQPQEYGLYEWLLISTGLRFTFSPTEMKQHKQHLNAAIGTDKAFLNLKHIEEQLLANERYLPLFIGKEVLTSTQEVQGIQINHSGYADFHQLWIK